MACADRRFFMTVAIVCEGGCTMAGHRHQRTTGQRSGVGAPSLDLGRGSWSIGVGTESLERLIVFAAAPAQTAGVFADMT